MDKGFVDFFRRHRRFRNFVLSCISLGDSFTHILKNLGEMIESFLGSVFKWAAALIIWGIVILIGWWVVQSISEVLGAPWWAIVIIFLLILRPLR